ncbi:MAG: hypothetical protein H6674_10115 [Dehalococcoidia bacterium]|nr:hypothetical protein [Dehalococcoidia bacterium]
MSEEAKRWRNAPVKDADSILLEYSEGGSTYTIAAKDHAATLESPRLLCGMTLLYSYALLEEHARTLCRALGVDESLRGGIESWASDLLAEVSRDWSGVKEGKAGAVEASIVRNAFAHGIAAYDTSMVNRYTNVQLPAPWQVGDPVVIDFDRLEELRARLRSLARVLGDGMTNLKVPGP